MTKTDNRIYIGKGKFYMTFNSEEEIIQYENDHENVLCEEYYRWGGSLKAYFYTI